MKNKEEILKMIDNIINQAGEEGELYTCELLEELKEKIDKSF
ncbi:hypothetical protein [Methanoculleus sp.]|jgi:DNA-binding ferritin-like protein|nr:hypothetical protein [Methanoculleus sp.]